jgi:hypothetical protein
VTKKQGERIAARKQNCCPSPIVLCDDIVFDVKKLLGFWQEKGKTWYAVFGLRYEGKDRLKAKG